MKNYMFIFLWLCQDGICTEKQRYDGWYNNLANPTWGSMGEEVMYKVTPAYNDLTYQPSGQDRPNPRLISNVILSGNSGLPSYVNHTALFAFFGQVVSYEVVHATDASCPVELLRVPVPPNDPDFDVNGTAQQYLPFTRSDYSRSSGQSPNNPRRPINKASAWIDGNFIYGRNEVWCNCIRSFVGGSLDTLESTKLYPGLNKLRLPLENYPNPVSHQQKKPEDLWMCGDAHSHQNPGLLALSVIWFRYHNYLAELTKSRHPLWGEERIFQTVRRRLVATLQNIIMYEWLPALLNTTIPQYTGYKNHIQPAVSAVFEAAAFRLGHSQIPPGIYVRDKECKFKKNGQAKAIRLCNSFWRSQEIVKQMGVEDLVLGMASQISEREDHIIVSDLRGKHFGPLHFSRHDLAVMTIMRGRDHGLPDYNNARRSFDLPIVQSWEDINPWLSATDHKIIDKLRKVYNGTLEKLDIFVGGLLESTPDGPGPLFTRVILDQFMRLRDGDRYWFEHQENGLFSTEEIDDIKQIKFKHVIMAATNIGPDEIQDDVFFWRDGDVCGQPKQLVEDDMEQCTPHHGYDYFVGSEVSYIMSFTCLCLVPLVCILVAYLMVKWKKNRQQGEHGPPLKDLHRPAVPCQGNIPAMEWTGTRNHSRHVELRFDSSKLHLAVMSDKKSLLRTVDLKKIDPLTVWLSTDKGRDLALLHIPKEYDLVLKFESEDMRNDFLACLQELLRPQGKVIQKFNGASQCIFRRAITKDKRQQLLTRFFKSVFSEAHNMKELVPLEQLEINECIEIVNCELTRAEFAEALALRSDSVFITQMFSSIDRDKDGYISFRELLYAVLLFSKGSCEDKLQLLFSMYDCDKSGTLSRTEVSQMIKSMLEMANTDLDAQEIGRMVDQMFVSSGLERRNSLRFRDFIRLFSGQMDMLWDVCLDWKGMKVCFPKKKEKESCSKTNGSSCKRDTPGTSKDRGQQRGVHVTFSDAVERNRGTATQSQIKLRKIRHYVQNHRQQIVYLILFFGICVMVSGERFYFYAVEQEHMGFRSLAGYGVAVSRAGAGGMSFTFSLLLLTMCRNSITKLRETVLNLYIPFDSHVAFHKVVAYTALLFTALHVFGYCFNLYHLATQPTHFLCVFDELYFRSDELVKFDFWAFRNVIGVTGVLLLVIIAIMYVFATETSRRHIFNAFWVTHKLYYILYILILLHGCVRLIQVPDFPFYFIGPAIIFTFDKMVSLSRKKSAISVISAELLPSDVTWLEFKRPRDFEYRSGQWIQVACTSLGKDDYHPLTLTSAPHEDTLSLHIRALGPWTSNIRHVFDPENLRDGPYPKLLIDGPFGAGQQDWFRYDVSILVGGGIGVTPYASILKDFVFMSSVKNTFRLKCQKVYFVWVTASQKHYEWFIDILRQVEEVDEKEVVETHIFITSLFQEFDLRTTMLYMCEEHFQKLCGRSKFTGLKAKTHFGRPNFEKVLEAVRDKHPKVRKVGVFSCGPPGLTKGVQKACHHATGHTKTRFEHHFENF